MPADLDRDEGARGRVRVELVREPGRVVPRPPDDEQHERRLGDALPGQVLEQQLRDLRDREDEDEVVEELERADAALALGLRAPPEGHAAAISAAGPRIPAKRGTTSSTLSRAQKAMSSSRPGGPYVRAFSPASASG